jgi:cytochrome c5
MSASHDTAHAAGNHPADHAAHDLPHEGPIRTPKQLIWAVVASFVVPIAGIILLVNYVNFDAKPAAGSTAVGEAAVAKRLQRVGTVEVRDAATAVARTGEQVVQGVCGGCHTAGLAGAPKTGDAAAWAPRIKTGYEALMTSALKGKGAMGAQGGGDYSDQEVASAVIYLANQSGATFAEPKAQAKGDAAAAAAPK